MNWFRWPWVWSAAVVLPYLVWRFRYRSAAIPFPGVAQEVPQSLRQKWIKLPNTLRFLALMLLIAAAAGPAWDQKAMRQVSSGIGIQILLDRSGSMQIEDMLHEGRLQSRLDVVKKISRDFIFGNGHGLSGRPSDMIGLIAFAADPVTLCPLTLTHDFLLPALISVRAAEGDQDGTAIGDAVTLAAARFELADRKQSSRLKSKVIILLTDGENNLGTRSVSEAATLAQQWGVRVYAIAIRPMKEGDLSQLEVSELELLALETRGIARVATDGSALSAIYSDIARLEKSDVSVMKIETNWKVFSILVFAALAMLATEVLLNQTWLRRIP
jgi:Ca-activated chloride channel family protein